MSLNLVDVCHRYEPRGSLVLDRACAHVDAHEVVALVGPSGSGKTTLLAIAGGLLRPSSGLVMLHGRPMHRRLLRSEISWVFQGTNALLGRSVIDNVAIRGLARGQRRAAATDEAHQRLAAVGLTHLCDRPARTLSGGELQRMCVARALMGDPALVCADEPTGQLDAVSTASVVRALTAAPRRRAMLLVATHDASVAARCDRVLELASGRLRVAP